LFRDSLDVTSPSQLWYETLAMPNLTVPAEEFDFKVAFTPFKYWTGQLAESWDISPDANTYTFHIRKGIRWQDIPPVNGRELTASDIEYTFHRQLGLGSGFTKLSPVVNAGNYALIESITATDKNTLVFKLKAPSLDMYYNLIDAHNTVQVVAREAVEKWGGIDDWKYQIGSGAYMMDDYVYGASLTVKRNPNYWGYDSLYPQNKLPYIDSVKILIIPDTATTLAALRSGKIDYVTNLNFTQRESLKRTNPELLEATVPSIGYGIVMQVDRAPYNDIRVRKAMRTSRQ
jgi:peptide/nickel transport system substrate-binding protein